MLLKHTSLACVCRALGRALEAARAFRRKSLERKIISYSGGHLGVAGGRAEAPLRSAPRRAQLEGIKFNSSSLPLCPPRYLSLAQ